jgi:hypothetical protein
MTLTRAPGEAPAPRSPAASADGYRALVERLSRQSVEKHFDAYADVDWDAAELDIDASDPRWELVDFDPLAHTDWYRNLPPESRSRLGLHRVAMTMRTGWEFENLLQRGLLSHVFWLPNRRPEFRYVHHEVVEESHHTMMFQEFVNRVVDRTGLRVRGMPRHMKVAAELFVLPLSRLNPALFFFFILGGEDPIDFVQRRRLRAGIAHPLLERIIRIHVTEEARHVSFARHTLERMVPRLPRWRRAMLSVTVPLVLGVMVRLMLSTPPAFVREHGIPRAAVREATRSAAHREVLAESVRKIRRLCTTTGLLNPVARTLWRMAGIWGPASGANGSGAARESEAE